MLTIRLVFANILRIIGAIRMNFVIRFLWFVLLGWWLGIIWFMLSILLMITIIFLPIGAYTLTKTWKLMTLYESPRKIMVNVENKIYNKTGK